EKENNKYGSIKAMRCSGSGLKLVLLPSSFVVSIFSLSRYPYLNIGITFHGDSWPETTYAQRAYPWERTIWSCLTAGRLTTQESDPDSRLEPKKKLSVPKKGRRTTSRQHTALSEQKNAVDAIVQWV